MKRLMLASILGMMLYASVAEALDYKDYKAAKGVGGVSWNSVKVFVNGVSEGFLIANAELAGQKRPLLYCQPDSFALNADNLLAILNDAMKKIEENTHTPLTDDMQIEAILLVGMQHTFPCKS